MSPPQALARAPNVSLQVKAKDWVPIFLVYVAAKNDAEDDEDHNENPKADQPSTSGRENGVTPISLIGSRQVFCYFALPDSTHRGQNR